MWGRRFGQPDRIEEGLALTVSPDGVVVYVTGYAQGLNSNDYMTIARIGRRPAPSGGRCGSTALSMGLTDLRRSRSAGTVALDADTGGVQWIRGYNGPGNSTEDDGHDVAVSPDGSTVFAPGTSGRVVDVDYATVAYDAGTGAQLWVSRFDGPSRVDQAVAIDVTPNGSAIYVTGESFVDSVTIAYDSTNGSQILEARYAAEPGGELIPVALSLSGDGSQFFVLAHDFSSTTNDYLTVAFDSATGVPVWSASYQGAAGSGIPASMAIDPIGLRLFVTGQATSTSENTDYATVAYQI